MKYIFLGVFFLISASIWGQNIDSIFISCYSADQIWYKNLKPKYEIETYENFTSSIIENIQLFNSNSYRFKFYSYEILKKKGINDTINTKFIICYDIKKKTTYKLKGFYENEFELFFNEYRKTICFLISDKKILQKTKVQNLDMECLYKGFVLNEDFFCGEKFKIGKEVTLKDCFK